MRRYNAKKQITLQETLLKWCISNAKSMEIDKLIFEIIAFQDQPLVICTRLQRMVEWWQVVISVLFSLYASCGELPVCSELIP